VKSILIIDDSPLIRRSLRTVFEQQPDWAVCGEAEDGYEAIDKAKILQPDLIVIDLAMPRLNGISASRMLKKWFLQLPSSCLRPLPTLASGKQHSLRVWTHS
jgi:two-component system response regulator YesN